MPPVYHMVFGIKFLLAFVLMFTSALLAGKTAAAEKLRGKMTFWLNVNVAIAVVVVSLAGVLRAVPKTPKADPASAQQTVVTEEDSRHG